MKKVESVSPALLNPDERDKQSPKLGPWGRDEQHDVCVCVWGGGLEGGGRVSYFTLPLLSQQNGRSQSFYKDHKLLPKLGLSRWELGLMDLVRPLVVTHLEVPLGCETQGKFSIIIITDNNQDWLLLT